jgi:hypothetical protein
MRFSMCVWEGCCVALLHELCRKHGQGGAFVMSPCACCKAVKTFKLVAWLWGWCCAWLVPTHKK